MPDAPNSDDRLKGALLVAATLTAAIRLRGEPIANTPRVIYTIHDSIKLRTLNAGQLRLTGCCFCCTRAPLRPQRPTAALEIT
jgi:hypothetical protein